MTDSELLRQLARQIDRIEYNQLELHKAMLVMLEQMADTVDDEPELDLNGNIAGTERDDTIPLELEERQDQRTAWLWLQVAEQPGNIPGQQSTMRHVQERRPCNRCYCG